MSNNNLITLKPLGVLKHLLMLNASSNKITKIFDFEYGLSIVNLSE